MVLSPEVNVQLLPGGQMAVHAPTQLPVQVRGPGQDRLQFAAHPSLPVHLVVGPSVVVELSDAAAAS
jgi:hypothetical protein